MAHYNTKLATDVILSAFNTLVSDLEHRINWGNDSAKPVSPNIGDRYIALDTHKLYFCYSAGTWTQFGGGASTFLDLTDVPSSYSEKQYSMLQVKGDESGLEFVNNERTFHFFIPTADLIVGTNKTYGIPAPFAGTILGVCIYCKVAPGTDKTITVDINKNGTTIFTTQSKRPTITGATQLGESDTPDSGSIIHNQILTVDIDVATDGHNATDMTIEIRYKIAML